MARFKSIFSNALIYGAGAISTKLVGFILLPIYTSHLSTDQYGQLAILEITAQAIVSLFGISLYRALNRWYWDKQYIDFQKSIFFSGLIVLSAIVLSLFLFIYLFSNTLATILLDSQQQSELIVFMGFSAGIQIIIHFILSLMRIQEKAFLYSVSNLSKLTLILILTIIFIVVYDLGILGIYQAQIIGQGLFLIIVYKYVKKNISWQFQWDVIKSMIKFSYPLALAGISGIVLSLTDRYALRFLTNFSDVGVYSLGFKVANTIKVFLVTSLQLAIAPIIYKMMDSDSRYAFYSKIMTYFSFIVMLGVLVISLFSKEIIMLLSKNDPDYWDASAIIPIISFSVFFGMLKDIATTGINISKKTKILAVILIVIAIVNTILNFLLIPVLNSTGAAIATLVSQILFFIIIYSSSQKVYPIPYEPKKLFYLIITSLCILVLSSFLHFTGMFLNVGIKLGLIFFFPVALYFQNYFYSEDLKWLTGKVLKKTNHP